MDQILKKKPGKDREYEITDQQNRAQFDVLS